MSETERMADDPDLVRRSLAGETGAFAQLVEKHQRLVFGVALSGARDAAVAEEVAQEAFVEAWRELRRLRDPSSVGSWIAGIARNLARSWSRTAARRRARTPAVTAELATPAATPLDAALDHEARTLVRRALDEIPAAYREALVLFYVQSRSVSEVAAGLGISEELAKQRLHRGRRALRDVLEARVEGALEGLRPSKSFTAGVMVAVSSTTATKASAATTAGAAGKLLFLMTANKLIISATTIALAGGALWYGLARDTGTGPVHAAVPTPPPGAWAPPPLPSTPDAAPPPRVRTGARKLASAAEREQLLASIRQAQAREERRSASSGGGGGGTSEAPADLDKEYIRSSVRELIPFIQECYESALQTQPTLAGTVVVSFTIEGTPEAGGLVTESSIDEKSEIKDPAFHECMRETMFALEIQPPSNGGTVKVTYPFAFSTAPPK
ncbi:MAG: sigma-70 family RNA polymerase sigma factor [Kofleriaceae bacterium]|nr:sigma-70 family RNA polymerase sigma factor [Kofleriaceae bacterium]